MHKDLATLSGGPPPIPHMLLAARCASHQFPIFGLRLTRSPSCRVLCKSFNLSTDDLTRVHTIPEPPGAPDPATVRNPAHRGH
jgi:hypothetical protein